MEKLPLTYAEINLQAVAHNTRELRKIIDPKAQFLVAVKANGYGHGNIMVARTALKHGANWLGTARMEEAEAIRKGGIDAPTLVFGYTPPYYVRELVEYNLVQEVGSLDSAQQLSNHARQLGVTIPVHIKIDTGMGRLGIPSGCEGAQYLNGESARWEIEQICDLPALDVQGVFTHFAQSDSNHKEYTKKQFESFKSILQETGLWNDSTIIKHAANSGAVIDLPETHLDMVRTGIAVYGIYPSNEVDKTRVSLNPVMSIKSQVIHIKTVSKGFKVSYGSIYETTKETVIATIPIGYGDGFTRLLSSKGFVLIQGVRVPVIGRVCMDLIMVDITNLSSVALGDEVIILGEQQGNRISAEDIAAAWGTINYEVTTTVSERVQKIYVNGDMA